MAYAGFLRRLVAYLVDVLIFYIFFFVLGLIFGGAGGGGQEIFGIIALVAAWLYFALMESSERQATLGKMAISIKVTNLEGDRISFGRATGRYFAKILSGIILLIGYIMAAFTAKKQGLHDMLAGTLVVMK